MQVKGDHLVYSTSSEDTAKGTHKQDVKNEHTGLNACLDVCGEKEQQM